MPRRLPLVFSAVIACALALPLNAQAASKVREIAHVDYQGMQKIRYRYGPVHITPGQNVIRINATDLKPSVPGYITRFKPDLVRVKDGKPPPVDVLHLHHAVWLLNNAPTFAAGEEKTITQFPRGFGLVSQPTDRWLLNDMLHNLLPSPDDVYVTWDIDFVPMTSPAAKDIKPVRTKWMDVAGIQSYPVFDAHRGAGTKGRYTFPQQARGAEVAKIGRAHRWTVPGDVTLVQTSGHLHPGGLWTDLRVTRNGVTKPLFRSVAKYFEPAGAVSWDVAQTVSSPSWRVRLKRGDVVTVSATYDTKSASWYEVMGIMLVAVHDGWDAGGVDPFVTRVNTVGAISHGHLSENDNHGGEVNGLPDARKLLGGATPTGPVTIDNFLYARGDLGSIGRAGRPPVIRAGESLTFRNIDENGDIFHTITSCRAPCNASAGIAYPLANGSVDFDSGELGFGPTGFTAAANRDTWKTPANLKPGTYTYFCRIHPFMRGAFRVKA